ncbi:MAG: hypothetical protein KJ579_12570 [Verrucomicrobia bacterium]|nr:hypothetical protein [Verrucomicrobiota bacterium]
MKRKAFAIGLTMLCAAVFAAPTVVAAADAAPAGQDERMSQGELAQLLVRKLGLLRFLPPNPSDLECIMILSQNGVFPSPNLAPTEQNPTPGWNADPSVQVTLADLAVVLVRAMRLEETVQGDKNDPQNWLNALQAVNVPTDTVEGGVQVLRPLATLLQNIAQRSTSGDPLVLTYIPESSGGGLLNTITFPDIKDAKQDLKDEGMPVPTTPT